MNDVLAFFFSKKKADTNTKNSFASTGFDKADEYVRSGEAKLSLMKQHVALLSDLPPLPLNEDGDR